MKKSSARRFLANIKSLHLLPETVFNLGSSKATQTQDSTETVATSEGVRKRWFDPMIFGAEDKQLDEILQKLSSEAKKGSFWGFEIWESTLGVAWHLTAFLFDREKCQHFVERIPTSPWFLRGIICQFSRCQSRSQRNSCNHFNSRLKLQVRVAYLWKKVVTTK